MEVEILGLSDSEKEEVFSEISALCFEWDYLEFGGLVVSGSSYDMQGFCLWLSSLDIIWFEV